MRAANSVRKKPERIVDHRIHVTIIRPESCSPLLPATLCRFACSRVKSSLV